MVVEKEITKLRTNVSNIVMSTRDLYRVAKETGERLRFDVIDKEQEMKPEKYGHKKKFVFQMDKDYDTFARAEMQVEMEFTDLNPVVQGGETLEKGDASIVVKATVIFDYRNEWGMKRSHRTLFSVYQNLLRDKLKKKYIVPLDTDAEAMHSALKEALDKYH